jgi:hypothetical protein
VEIVTAEIVTAEMRIHYSAKQDSKKVNSPP